MKNIENTFTAELLWALTEAQKLTGVEETRLRQQAEKFGGSKAVTQMIDRRQQTRQFQPLKKMNRLDLTVEALVIQGKYGDLFSDEQVNACLQVLLENGMF